MVEHKLGPGLNFSSLTNYTQKSEDLQDYLPPTSIGIDALRLLTIYFDQVVPNEHEKSRGMFFFFESITRFFKWIRQRGRSSKGITKAADLLKMFTEPNELFALLEQGGVGKSTTLQIFHRVTNPTSENAFLFNQSILTGMSEISASMDVCPQHDVFFNDSTC
ncbi:hypothetical protein BGZ54_000910 [Gamsiella multidivaricata]|nr:hypothetical protein BGZ54_000910 [Gamsiella multidivaricata]